jgi:hypothetical protein
MKHRIKPSQAGVEALSVNALRLFDTISDGQNYTQVEKHTIKYLRDNYNWTDEADALFRTRVRSWAAHEHELA